MTAVVLARGVGRRMRRPAGAVGLTPGQSAIAATGRKAMIPVGARGRPFLDHVLTSLADAGCDRVCLVLGPDQDDVCRRYRTDAVPSRFDLQFVQQATAAGTAHAVLAAEPITEDDAFLVVNADNHYPATVLRDLVALAGPGLAAFTRQDLAASSNILPRKIAAFALIDVDEAGWLNAIVEKPAPDLVARRPEALVSMNLWRFDRRIFSACRDVAQSVRGEFELPEAVALALDRGVRFRAVRAHGPVLDLSGPEDIPEVSARLADAEVRL
ncbi:MAG: sugar phosphate nucleotidyltransferase [Acidobacteriota bacterium]